MKGLLFKELYQNKFTFSFALLFAPTIIAFMFIVNGISAVYDGDSFSDGIRIFYEDAENIINVAMYLMTVMVVDLIIMKSLDCDEMKKWAYFISSTPELVKGQIYTKYLSVFMHISIMSVSIYVVDLLLCAICNGVLGMVIPSFAVFSVIALYYELFVKAVEIHFIVRFGSKRGNAVKAAMIGGFFVLLMLYFLFGPLPADEDAIMEALYQAYEKLINGELNEWVYFVQGILPFAAVGSYILSYFISCKLYLKGVETYDK